MRISTATTELHTIATMAAVDRPALGSVSMVMCPQGSDVQD